MVSKVAMMRGEIERNVKRCQEVYCLRLGAPLCEFCSEPAMRRVEVARRNYDEAEEERPPIQREGDSSPD